MQPTPEQIHHAAEVLRQGGLVAFPTETVYGLGADALNAAAVARIFEVKGRPSFDPLIVHVADVGGAQALTAGWPDAAARLADAFWPGPLTLVLPRRPVVPDLVTSGLPNVGVRVPDHPVALAMIREAGVPIAAPSANRFGRTSPTTTTHVREEFAGRPGPDAILDGGPCRTGVESTVVSLAGERPTVLRLGGTPLEALRDVAGEVAVAKPDAAGAENEAAGRASPGMLDRHYAPRTRLIYLGAGEGEGEGDDARPITHPAFGMLRGRRVGVLAFDPSQLDALTARLDTPPAAAEVLSQAGDEREAAAHLFAAMRRLDAAAVDAILAGPAPARGLGAAINDRLERASR